MIVSLNGSRNFVRNDPGNAYLSGSSVQRSWIEETAIFLRACVKRERLPPLKAAGVYNLSDSAMPGSLEAMSEASADDARPARISCRLRCVKM